MENKVDDTRRVNIERAFIRGTETPLEMNANVALYLLDV